MMRIKVFSKKERKTVDTNSRWPKIVTTIKKVSQMKKFCSQDLLTYSKKDLLINTNSKYPQQIPTANSRICKAEDGAQYPLCGRASHVKIKRN